MTPTCRAVNEFLAGRFELCIITCRGSKFVRSIRMARQAVRPRASAWRTS